MANKTLADDSLNDIWLSFIKTSGRETVAPFEDDPESLKALRGIFIAGAIAALSMITNAEIPEDGLVSLHLDVWKEINGKTDLDAWMELGEAAAKH